MISWIDVVFSSDLLSFIGFDLYSCAQYSIFGLTRQCTWGAGITVFLGKSLFLADARRSFPPEMLLGTEDWVGRWNQQSSMVRFNTVWSSTTPVKPVDRSSSLTLCIGIFTHRKEDKMALTNFRLRADRVEMILHPATRWSWDAHFLVHLPSN